MQITFSHLGLAVSDLDRSLYFYCDGLGFVRGASHEIGDEFSTLMGLETVRLRSQFIGRDGVQIELLHFDSPTPSRGQIPRMMSECGLTHLNLRVDDIDAVAAAIETHGGAVDHTTRTTFGPTLDFLYCADPDGTRIELMRLPD